jgi:hypothetical protein
VVALMSAAAWGAPLRVAIVYGHNGGAGPRSPLKYAEADARRVAQTLTEVGGVAPENLRLLTGRPLSELRSALTWARGRLARGPQASLVVYLSAHADAKRGLLPGGEALPWPTLKSLVAATGAKVRLTIVDGCQASGLIEAGARPAPAFSITAEDELTVQGDAFITSSASDEPSLEAGQFRGSVFTQHLVAGLRGAADRSGDGRVSLEEAYRFAFERTMEGESGQHPGFATHLSGYGELIVANPGVASGLEVPEGADHVVVKAVDSQDPWLSVRRPEARRLAVPPGDWRVSVELATSTREGRVTVKEGRYTPVELDRLTAVERATRWVRLEAETPCFEVRPARVDPRVVVVAPRVAQALVACADGQHPLATVVVEPGPSGRVRVRAEPTPGDPGFEASASLSEADRLIEAVRAWAAVRSASSAKRTP